MIRLFITLLLLTVPGSAVVSAQTSERAYTDMPVYVLYCDEDPGRINAGGGKSPSPQELIANGTCTPAEGVAVTFVLAEDDWNFETDDPAEEIDWDVQDDGWFNRCDIDAEGFCALNSPAGFDIVLGVVLHENTVKPGYEPAFFQRATHNFTEFAGWGLALVPTDSATPGAEPADHQTLSLNVTQNGEPASVLTEWEFNDKDSDTYLATNAEGWVSNIVNAGDVIDIDLANIDDHEAISMVCSANDDASLEVSFAVDGDDLTITVPETESDLRCDISIGS